ncbi:MAG: putative glycolipid-binding domain-containing protein [Chloroflexota bacterium]
MLSDVIWAPRDAPGFEHLRLNVGEGAVAADGLVVSLAGGALFRLHYGVYCDAAWRVREVRLSIFDVGEPLVLLADGRGHWSARGGGPLPALDGCLDVDISATPFTNTLPIRRLPWHPGASAELRLAYVEVPSLRLTAERQRYTCLEQRPDGATFRFEALASGFTADLQVDAEGLVIDYPGLFKRVWAG